jgi:glycosyltransferase involved in cell wall biosynthesis
MGSVSFGFILSCWKHCEYVEQSVNSILNQSYSNTKVILFCEKCQHKFSDARVMVISDGFRRGHCNRLNTGLQMLNTDYVTFFGVDDYLVNGCLLRVADFIDKTGKRIWYYGDHYQKENNAVHLKIAYNFDIDRFKNSSFISGGSVFALLDVMKKHRFETRPIIRISADRIMWSRLLLCDEPVYYGFANYVERLNTGRARKRGMRMIRRWLVHRYINKIIENR